MSAASRRASGSSSTTSTARWRKSPVLPSTRRRNVSSTNSRIADDTLLPSRPRLIAATSSDTRVFLAAAISVSASQNPSSRLTLVLWPAMTMDRFRTVDCDILSERRRGERGSTSREEEVCRRGDVAGYGLRQAAHFTALTSRLRLPSASSVLFERPGPDPHSPSAPRKGIGTCFPRATRLLIQPVRSAHLRSRSQVNWPRVFARSEGSFARSPERA
jgi:hypothetical protein